MAVNPKTRIGPYEIVASLVDPYVGFDLAPDGKSLVFVKFGGPGDKQAIGVIENWFAEFKDRS